MWGRLFSREVHFLFTIFCHTQVLLYSFRFEEPGFLICDSQFMSYVIIGSRSCRRKVL